MHEEDKESKYSSAISIASRIAGMGLAVASAVLMPTASQCTIYAAYGAPPRTVTFSDFHPLLYLVVANSVAAFLEAITIFLEAWKKGKKAKKVLRPVLSVAVQALQYSATAAGFAADTDMSYCSVYGKRIRFCDESPAGGTGKFCAQVKISVFVSLAAAVQVSTAEVVTAMGGSASSHCDSDSDSSFDGCHHKH